MQNLGSAGRALVEIEFTLGQATRVSKIAVVRMMEAEPKNVLMDDYC